MAGKVRGKTSQKMLNRNFYKVSQANYGYLVWNSNYKTKQVFSQIKNESENTTIKIGSLLKAASLVFHGECYGEFGKKAAHFPYS